MNILLIFVDNQKLRNVTKCQTCFAFIWSITIFLSKILVHYIISTLLTNPAEDFQFHLMQVGVYDHKRIIHVLHCTIQHTKSKSTMKSFLFFFFKGGKWNQAPVRAINVLQEPAGLGASDELVLTLLQTVHNSTL